MASRTRPSIDELPDVCQVRQVADFCGVAENTVYDAIRRRDLPAARLGRRVLVSKLALMRWLEGQDSDEQTCGAGAS